MNMVYHCSVCGDLHDDLPDIGFQWPEYVAGISGEERRTRIALTTDTCVLDDEHFFIRGVLEIPVHDYPEHFGFGVWVSQRRDHFEAYVQRPDAADLGPYFGWLSNEITFYQASTLELKAMVYFRGGALRPAIVVEPTDHPLARDQHEGMSLERAWMIVHHYLEGDGGAASKAAMRP